MFSFVKGMKYITILSLFIVITGCVAQPSVKEHTAPDGTTIKKVKCNIDPEKCFVAASSSCPNKTYQVLSSESHAGGTLADIIPGPVTWFGMTYVCGPSDGKMPDFPFQGAHYNPPPPSPIVIQENRRQRTRMDCRTTSTGQMDCISY